MNVLTDEEVLALLRPLQEMERERATVAETVGRLRLASDPQELAERNRCGNRMAELDRKILQLSGPVLERIGLWNAAVCVGHVAEANGITPDA